MSSTKNYLPEVNGPFPLKATDLYGVDQFIALYSLICSMQDKILLHYFVQNITRDKMCKLSFQIKTQSIKIPCYLSNITEMRNVTI